MDHCSTIFRHFPTFLQQFTDIFPTIFDSFFVIVSRLFRHCSTFFRHLHIFRHFFDICIFQPRHFCNIFRHFLHIFRSAKTNTSRFFLEFQRHFRPFLTFSFWFFHVFSTFWVKMPQKCQKMSKKCPGKFWGVSRVRFCAISRPESKHLFLNSSLLQHLPKPNTLTGGWVRAQLQRFCHAAKMVWQFALFPRVLLNSTKTHRFREKSAHGPRTVVENPPLDWISITVFWERLHRYLWAAVFWRCEVLGKPTNLSTLSNKSLRPTSFNIVGTLLQYCRKGKMVEQKQILWAHNASHTLRFVCQPSIQDKSKSIGRILFGNAPTFYGKLVILGALWIMWMRTLTRSRERKQLTETLACDFPSEHTIKAETQRLRSASGDGPVNVLHLLCSAHKTHSLAQRTWLEFQRLVSALMSSYKVLSSNAALQAFTLNLEEEILSSLRIRRAPLSEMTLANWKDWHLSTMSLHILLEFGAWCTRSSKEHSPRPLL